MMKFPEFRRKSNLLTFVYLDIIFVKKNVQLHKIENKFEVGHNTP
jgi:hypothetical protein